MSLSEPMHDGWAPPPATPVMGAGEVHLWRADLDVPRPTDGSLVAVLDADERARAQRFLSEAARETYIVCRAILRSILACYLSVDPAAVRLATGPHGKPFLAGEPDVRFNLSHSGRVALFAVALRADVGVDVERVRDDVDFDSIASRFFSVGEREILARVPETLRREAFFTCWVRKEAFVKARGEGLSLDLTRFTVTVDPGEPPRVVEMVDGREEASRWALIAVDAGPGYAAAVAAEDPVRAVSRWEWAAVAK